jgi:putative oxidoreductase
MSLIKLFDTNQSGVNLALRVAVGAVMLPHGAQKLLGWFGGYGYSGTMQFFTETMGIPTALAFLVIMAESVGALALIAGAFTRASAFGMASVMAGAIALSHWRHGFFINWFGAQGGEGFEFHLLILAVSAALVISGGGLGSLDRLIARRLGRAQAPVRTPASGGIGVLSGASAKFVAASEQSSRQAA